jgi:hypothetical protein
LNENKTCDHLWPGRYHAPVEPTLLLTRPSRSPIFLINNIISRFCEKEKKGLRVRQRGSLMNRVRSYS